MPAQQWIVVRGEKKDLVIGQIVVLSCRSCGRREEEAKNHPRALAVETTSARKAARGRDLTTINLTLLPQTDDNTRSSRNTHTRQKAFERVPFLPRVTAAVSVWEKN